MKKLIISALLLAVSGPALAADWYLFETQSEKCVEASAVAARNHAPFYSSPAQMRIFMRDAFPTTYGGTSILNFPDGGKMVELKNGQRAIYYFSSKTTCLSALHIMRKKDLIPNLNELK